MKHVLQAGCWIQTLRIQVLCRESHIQWEKRLLGLEVDQMDGTQPSFEQQSLSLLVMP